MLQRVDIAPVRLAAALTIIGMSVIRLAVNADAVGSERDASGLVNVRLRVVSGSEGPWRQASTRRSASYRATFGTVVAISSTTRQLPVRSRPPERLAAEHRDGLDPGPRFGARAESSRRQDSGA